MALVYQDFIKMLHINKHRLDDELEIQSDILNQINQHLTIASQRVAQAKEDLDKNEAEYYLELTRGEDKMTVAQAQAKIQLYPERIKFWQSYQLTVTSHKQWQGLYDAWKSRGFDLKALGQLYADQYFAIDSAGQTHPAGGRKHEYERTRNSMSEQRTQRRALD